MSNSLDSGVYLHIDGTTQSATVDNSIFGVWNGDNNTNDSVGSNHGTSQGGLTYSAGKFGNAFQFNGTNAFVKFPNNSMNFTGDFTISAWVYITSGGPQTILSNEYYDGTNIKGWAIYIDNLGAGQTARQLQFIIYRNNTSDYTGYNSTRSNATPTGISLNTWTHIAIVRKSGLDTYIYLNGERLDTSLVGASAITLEIFK